MRTITEAMKHILLQQSKYYLDTEEYQTLNKIWYDLARIALEENRI